MRYILSRNPTSEEIIEYFPINLTSVRRSTFMVCAVVSTLGEMFYINTYINMHMHAYIHKKGEMFHPVLSKLS